MNDFKLIAINQLIEKYELDLAKNINMDNEQNLDIMQISNLHKMEMVTLGFELGNNVDLMSNIKDRIEETTPRIETKEYNMKVVSPHEECSTESPEIVYEVKDSETKKSNKSNKTINYTKSKFYKKNVKRGNEAYAKLVETFKDYQDELGCIDCKNVWNYKEGELIPEYEISWELKKFLADLKSLVADIKDSLDSTKLLKDFCVYFELFKGKNKLCLSSWPLLLASFPVLINKAKFGLLEIGLSWTGIIGPIIAPLLSIAVKIGELLRDLFVVPIDCIIRALLLMKETLVALDRVIASYVEQAKMVGTTLSNLSFDGVEVDIDLLGSRAEKLEEDIGRAATGKEESKVNNKEPNGTALERFFDSIYDKFTEAAARTKDTNPYSQRKVRAREASSDSGYINADKVTIVKKLDDQKAQKNAVVYTSSDKRKYTTTAEESEKAPEAQPVMPKRKPRSTPVEPADYQRSTETGVKEKGVKRENPLFLKFEDGTIYTASYELRFSFWSDNAQQTAWNGEAPKYTVMKLVEPIRIVIDLINVDPKLVEPQIQISNADYSLPITKVRIIRLGKGKNITSRLIFYLKKDSEHVPSYNNGIFVFKIKRDRKLDEPTAIPQIKQEEFETVSYAYIQPDPINVEPPMAKPATEKVKEAIKPKAKSESNASKKKDDSGLSFGFKTQDPYAYRTSLTVKSDSIFTNTGRESYLGGAIKTFDIIIQGAQNARSAVDDFFNKYIYLMKSIQRLIIEPIFISSKLIGEIKVALNLIRLFKVLAELINSDFKGICKDFNNDNNNSFIKSLIEKEFEDTIIDVENQSGERGELLVKGRDSDFVSRLEPNDCGEILIKMNHKQRDLDLIYDKIANSIR